MTLHQLRYPIGRFERPALLTPEMRDEWIAVIASFPALLIEEVVNLTNEQLDTPYREGGWTLRQVVHHCADSHLNALSRIKLALTEDKPVIKPYYEDRWAELSDSKDFPIAASLDLLTGLHQRWTVVLKSLTDDELEKTYIHPEHGKAFSIGETIGMYAWHCRHHLAHITGLKETKGW